MPKKEMIPRYLLIHIFGDLEVTDTVTEAHFQAAAEEELQIIDMKEAKAWVDASWVVIDHVHSATEDDEAKSA